MYNSAGRKNPPEICTRFFQVAICTCTKSGAKKGLSARSDNYMALNGKNAVPGTKYSRFHKSLSRKRKSGAAHLQELHLKNPVPSPFFYQERAGSSAAILNPRLYTWQSGPSQPGNSWLCAKKELCPFVVIYSQYLLKKLCGNKVFNADLA